MIVVVNQILILGKKVGRWRCVIVRTEDGHVILVCQRAPYVLGRVASYHHIGIDEPKNVSLGLTCTEVARGTRPTSGAGRYDLRTQRRGERAGPICGSVIHNDNFAELASLMHHDEGCEAAVNKRTAIIGRHDGRYHGCSGSSRVEWLRRDLLWLHTSPLG